MIFDPVYLLLMAPAFIFSLITSFWVKSAFRKYSKVATASGLTGAQAAARVLRSANVNNVQIEATRGFLSDHYDPSKKVLRLSPDVYQGNSVASIGVAAHEAGHAIQDAAGYAPMKLRTAIVPMASIGSNLSWLLLIGGMILRVGGAHQGRRGPLYGRGGLPGGDASGGDQREPAGAGGDILLGNPHGRGTRRGQKGAYRGGDDLRGGGGHGHPDAHLLSDSRGAAGRAGLIARAERPTVRLPIDYPRCAPSFVRTRRIPHPYL